ncbi:colanic acid biosynthesis pyruvyl transferase WcaK [Erwinia tasmaniensis]|uniref:Exopolysaccharide biosynthesis protein n=1 Tax=Erwinia tasmaniensis (strain DSM 17950 / CFBP 7177 / CIP 109463 / NCPPB 4357 / Et1/99) TaxID=465817 RepID=B2VFP6_ERWT9|nr:colanic acid biosynthesis pyruvyl transferase WcaK [Erwinia tasmaniensis]CAO96376.1 Exopolysaccharide biosynthesis protein [Erwinia tasmaniensis Et1/99]
MKILLVGNHTCGNRGDGAILRGIIDSLYLAKNDIQIDVISRFPTCSSYLLQQDILPDELFLETKKSNTLVTKIKRRLMPKIMMAHIRGNGFFKNFAVPRYLQKFTDKLTQYDAVIQVGGSFFVDLYGPLQFEHALCALLAKKPLYMIGHSVGPFQKERFNQIANFVFARVNSLVLRESVSLEMMESAGITTQKVIPGADTAFLVRSRALATPGHNLIHWQKQLAATKTIAITVRELAPFDKRLGVTQQEYEMAFGKVINAMIDRGYQVVALSTCTGIDSYHRDDRMVAITLLDYIKDKDKYHVIMDEFNDLELGILLGECHLTIGTRLHSAIISMNFGTPAVAINYEHKSLGVMKQLGLPEMASDVQSLMDGSIISKVNGVLDNYEAVEQQVARAVEQERSLGNKITADFIKSLG